MALELKKFDPRRMTDYGVVVAVARRCSGKSELIKDLMYYKRHIPCGIVCSGTEDGNSFYQGFVPEVFVYNHFDKAAIERLVERQRQALKTGKVHPVFLVLDDLLYDKKFLNDKLVRYLFMNGRHFKIMLYMTAQYLVDVPPSIRAQIDYVFVLRDNQHREKLWKNLFTIFKTYDQFCAAMDVCTADYGALVLDNTSPSTNIAEVVYYYKAKVGRQFRMGNSQFWKFSHSRGISKNQRVDEGKVMESSRPTSLIKKI